MILRLSLLEWFSWSITWSVRYLIFPSNLSVFWHCFINSCCLMRSLASNCPISLIYLALHGFQLVVSGFQFITSFDFWASVSNCEILPFRLLFSFLNCFPLFLPNLFHPHELRLELFNRLWPLFILRGRFGHGGIFVLLSCLICALDFFFVIILKSQCFSLVPFGGWNFLRIASHY